MEKKRYYYLDFLKVFLILVVIFHHAGQAYGDGGGWAYTPTDSREYCSWLWRYFSLNAGFFMGMFFMISAYFIPSSYDRQGFALFVKKKLLRLGLPMLLFCTALSLIMGEALLAHLWFVLMLLVLSLTYALFRLVTKDKCLISSDTPKLPQLVYLLFLTIVLAVLERFTRDRFPQDFWVSISTVNFFEPVHLPQYLLMFYLGLWSRRKNFFETMSDTAGVVCLSVCGLIAAALLLNPFGLFSFEKVWPWWWAVESVFCISVSFGLIWFARKFLNHDSRVLSFMADQEYGVYIFHLTNMLLIQHFFDGLYVGGGIMKMLFIGVVTSVVTFFLTCLLRLIPGVKKVL